MLRTLVLALFIIPKVVIWPLIWFIRCRLKKQCDKPGEEIPDNALVSEITKPEDPANPQPGTVL
ncbi:MAG: hypothetical protein KGZ79_05965 [Dethiobacter sp.]|nr:hypothetical protein [Dethiobacter sp.]